MTIVIEKYKTENKTATIEKHKDSNLFYVTIYTEYKNIPIVEYKNDFMTVQNARKAIKRHCPGIVKIKTGG